MTAWLRRRRRAGRDRGAVAVEAALITPLFALIVFGIIEFGFLFKDSLAVTSSVRAGVRIASAEPRYVNFATDAAAQVAREGTALDMSHVKKLWVYQANEDGYPLNSGNSFASCTTNCVKFNWDAGTGTFQPEDEDAWPYTDHDACQGEQDSVGVYLAIEDQALTGMFFDSMTLDSHTVMRFEPIPTLSGCK